MKQQYLDAGQPVISMDTKKKEMLGNFYCEGVTDGVEPTIVNDHDFASFSNGKVIPHGIYDVAKNEASLHLNCSKDTSELACESIELWFSEQGRADYPDATELLGRHRTTRETGTTVSANYSADYSFQPCLPTPIEFLHLIAEERSC